MQRIQEQINVLHILFYMCLGLCIFLLILGVIFFFKFNIWNIFNDRTGRSLRKTVQSMEEKNARIDSLRRPAEKDYLHTPAVDSESFGKTKTQALSPEDFTSVLEQAQKEADQSYGLFHIETCTMLIHTTEVN